MTTLRGNRGNMPFAVIAVTILVLSLGYGIVSSRISDSEENTSRISGELDSIDEVLRKTEAFVNRGMGELIVSMGTGSGTVSSKFEDFGVSSENWLNAHFPSLDGCVRITILDVDVELSTENLQNTDGGYTPTYVRAEGEFTARYDSGGGSAVKTLRIKSDGSCALPLVSEMGSIFNVALSGDGSVLSQMMTYQLTALAQERVISGYGSLAVTGDMGTERILTAEDVEKSYRSCVSAIQLLSFRNSSEGTASGTGNLDLADLIISDDGHIALDLGAIYSQALISVLDDIILQWADYFCGNLVVDFLEGASDRILNAWDSIVGFFTGKDTVSASPYIREVMEQNGYSESEYRYLLNGNYVEYHVPEFSITKKIDGESHTISVGGFDNRVEYPNVDILAWNGIKNFKSEYRLENNEIREWMRSILNTAAVNVGADRSIGRISVPIDPDDGVPFIDNVRDAVNGSLARLDGDVEKVVNSSVRNQSIYDPFYSAICTKLTQNFDSVFGVGKLRDNMLRSVDLSAVEQRLINSGLDEGERNYLMGSLRSAILNDDVVAAYHESARDMLERFDALLTVPGGQDGLIKKFMIMINERAMPMLSVINDIPERMVNLCDEMCSNMRINPYSGIIDVPEQGFFSLIGSEGNVKETIVISDGISPDIIVRGPGQNLDDCVHYVGFNQKKGASYSTAFRVSLNDILRYSAEGYGTISSILGSNNSLIEGEIPVSLDLKIVVVSGWELSGVPAYKASNTIFSDGWDLLVKALDPLLEPLREFLRMINDIIAILGPVLMEISKYASMVIERLYNAVLGPMIEMKKFVDEGLGSLMSQAIGELGDVAEFIFKATLKKQTVGLSFLGLTLTFSTDIASYSKSVKNILITELSGELSGLWIKCGMTIKEKDLSSGKDYFITGEAAVKGDGWDVKVFLDPLMKTRDVLATISGEVRGTSFDICFPYVVQYKEAGVRLSDIEGIGTALSNIPLPAVGLKGSLDAGLDLKYNVPFKTGVVVNEFESNPPGADSGNEWVELYNSTASTVDISGYTLVAGSNEKTKRMTIENTALSSRERLVITLDKHMVLLNDKNDALNGECVILLDDKGVEIDRSIVGKDRDNSNYTWQRVADGALDWTFADGTPGSGNCGGLINGDLVKGQMTDIFKKSAIKTLSNMGGVLNGTEELNEFLQRAMQDAITTTIDTVAACLVEASVFISFEVSDLSGSSTTGMRLALSIDSKTVGDTIKFLVGEIESLLFNMENPYGIDGGTMLYENIDLAVTAYTGMSAPGFLNNSDLVPEIRAGIYIASNLSGLCGMFGIDAGRWSVTAGIVMEDCPSILIPSIIKIDQGLKSDLWLVRAVIGKT